MHNCRRMEGQFVDLLFDEIDTERQFRLLKEIENCAHCLGQYHSLSDTLFIVGRTTTAATVNAPESYWPRYNASLRERLLAPAPVASIERSVRGSFWKRLLTTRLPVPVPVVAAIAIGLILSSALALKRSPVSQTMSAPAPPSSVKIIEVPTVQERIVTRTVYVERKQAKERAPEASLPDVTATSGSGDEAVADDKHKDDAGFFTRANLKGFQPAEDMKIRVLKRNNTDDK